VSVLPPLCSSRYVCARVCLCAYVCVCVCVCVCMCACVRLYTHWVAYWQQRVHSLSLSLPVTHTHTHTHTHLQQRVHSECMANVGGVSNSLSDSSLGCSHGCFKRLPRCRHVTLCRCYLPHICGGPGGGSARAGEGRGGAGRTGGGGVCLVYPSDTSSRRIN